MVLPITNLNSEKAIFLAAIEIDDATARATFLDERCGKGTTVRSGVEALIACHLEDDFLQDAANIELVRDARDSVAKRRAEVSLQLGEIVDNRYRLLKRLGEGGCGSVFRAEQLEPVRREVALKVVKLGMDSECVLSRFDAEKQALAMMDHTGIARVYDGGTTELGRPYFVMELVRGVRITEYAQTHKLGLVDRLKLFIDVCHAIQHAHQKGVIHRDIKPSNILVSEVDGCPRAKVIDFGIAKALDQSLTDQPTSTAIHLFIGTPAYTSPEQAAMSGEKIDTRSDVYSLGILLYELIAGTPPFDPSRFSKNTIDGMRQIICEETPLRPSIRLSMDSGERSSLPAETPIPEDLDWIAMKCLEKDSAMRYPTVNGLAKDLNRYLQGEPVFAHPPSALYRFHRFVRRNWAAAVTALVILFSLIATTAISTWMAVRAVRAEQETGQALNLAESLRLEALQESYISDMNLVRMAMTSNNRGRATELLQRHVPLADMNAEHSPPDFRHWEWRYFAHQTQSAATLELPRQAHRIRSVAFGRSDGIIGSLDERNAFRLWDVHSGTALARVARTGVIDFVFSPGGQFVATAERGLSSSTNVHLWSTETGRTYRLRRLDSVIQAIGFSEDGTALLMVDRRFRLHRWHFEANTLRSTALATDGRESYRRRPMTVQFSLTGRRLAFNDRGDVHVHDTATGERIATIHTFVNNIAAMAFSPDDRAIAIGPSFLESDSDVLVFEIDSGTQIGLLEGHSSWVSGLAFTADGERLVTSGADQTVRIWNVAEKRTIEVIRGHSSEVNCVGISATGEFLVSGGKDGSLLVWEPNRVQNVPPFESLPERVRDVVFLGHHDPLISHNLNGSLSAWDPDTFLPVNTFGLLEILDGQYSEFIVSPNGRYIAAKRADGRGFLVDVETYSVQEFEAQVRGRILGFSGQQGDLLHVDPEGRLLLQHNESPVIRSLSVIESRFRPVVSPTESLVLYPNGLNEVRLMNWVSGNEQILPKVDDWGIAAMAFSDDGSQIAAGLIDGSVRLWDVQSGAAVATIHAHLLGTHGVAFSPDGERLASSSSKQEAVKIWDLRTFREVATLPGTGVTFSRVRFSPDGVLLVAINRRGKVHIWRAPRDSRSFVRTHSALEFENASTTVAVGRKNSL